MILKFLYLICLLESISCLSKSQDFLNSIKSDFFLKTRSKDVNLKLVKSMFQFGYSNYMKYAHPLDELDPIHCRGRGPDTINKDNININDVLGNYQLTLVDSLDSLLIMNETEEFKRAVSLLMDTLHFDLDSTVQVFEATIRIIGSLISTHLLIIDERKIFGDIKPKNYSDDLLYLANDLASRLLTAFYESSTGIPHPRVHLKTGVPTNSVNESCLAGATTLLLEFGALSRLMRDPVYEKVARRTIMTFWSLKSNVTGLLGNVINIQSGKWTGNMAGLGAGQDSFYEYLLKGYIMFNDRELLKLYSDVMESVRYYLRRGRPKCSVAKHSQEISKTSFNPNINQYFHDRNNMAGSRNNNDLPPMYVNVKMDSGDLDNKWIDSLQAVLPTILILDGKVDEAVCIHAYYYAIWRKYKVLPERFNWYYKSPEVNFYPLRPEFAESTYFLYRATKSPFYLKIGEEILDSLNTYTKAKCGYATVHDVNNMSLEDRMESFFLSETCKYLYLLFDENNPVNRHQEDYLFTTQGHLFSISQLHKISGILFEFNKNYSVDAAVNGEYHQTQHYAQNYDSISSFSAYSLSKPNYSSCENPDNYMRYQMPLSSEDLQQIFSIVQ